MSSNIDHEALINKQIDDDKKAQSALQKRIEKEVLFDLKSLVPML